MKKSIAVFILIVSVVTLSAQVNFGIKAGYNSTLNWDNAKTVTSGDYSFKTAKAEFSNSFHGGVFIRFNFDKLYLEPELLYAMQNKHYQITLKDASQDVDLDKYVDIRSVEMPVLLGYKLFGIGNTFNVHAFAGPKLRFNAGSTLEYKNIEGGNFDVDQLKKDVKDAQVGLEVGAGIDLFMLVLDVRYTLINNLYKTTFENVSLESSPENTFVISLGWKIN